MSDDQILFEDELIYFKRGRNAKSHTKAKNTDVVTYRISTGIEALFGYLYLSNRQERLQTLMAWIFDEIETGRIKK